MLYVNFVVRSSSWVISSHKCQDAVIANVLLWHALAIKCHSNQNVGAWDSKRTRPCTFIIVYCYNNKFHFLNELSLTKWISFLLTTEARVSLACWASSCRLSFCLSRISCSRLFISSLLCFLPHCKIAFNILTQIEISEHAIHYSLTTALAVTLAYKVWNSR